MIVLDAYSMLRWLVHGYYTRNACLPVMWLVHRNYLLLVHGNTRCSYGMLQLVHGNDIVIYPYGIQQIHITFYWVSTYK